MSVNYRLVEVDPERLFAVLADGWTYSSWVVGASRIRAVGESWPQPGQKLHHSVGLWPLIVDDTTSSLNWQPPTLAILRADGGPLGVLEVRFDVQKHLRGCVVRMTEDAVGGPSLLIPRTVRDVIGRVRNREALRRLAYLAERRTDGSSRR